MKSILITGAAGFIGSHFLNYLSTQFTDEHLTIVVIDKLDYCSRTKNWNFQERKNFHFFNLDINATSDILKILVEYQVDTIVHFAAQTHVDNSFGNSLQFTKDNVLGTHSLLEAVKVYGKLKKFIHMSTDEVYGEVSIDGTSTEKDLLNPTNPYAATKAGAEFLVRSYGHSFKLPYIIIRCNNVYGEGQYPEKLIPRFTVLLCQGKKCTIHGQGLTRRNFIHGQDVARAVLTILQNGTFGETYNISTNNEYTVMEIAQKIISQIYPSSTLEDWIEYVRDRDFNDFRYCIDGKKLRDLGWSEQVDFETGFRDTVEWYRQRYEEWNL